MIGGLFFVLVFAGIGGMGDTIPTPPPVTGECNDSLDNDLDGGIDHSGLGPAPADPECRYSGIDSGGIEYACPNWGSETVGPMSFIECTT